MPSPSDLVHQTTTSTGTGALTLVAENGKRSFLTAFGTGGTNTFDYFISHRGAAEWERGTGHENAGTLVRDTVKASSNSNNAVNFSAGTKDVTNDVPAIYQGILTRIFTPEQFGAAGDGSTDDATPFTSMFSAVTAASGGMCVLTKTYLLGSAVTLPNNVRIVGDGKATIKAHATNAIAGLFTTTHSGAWNTTLSSNAAKFDRQLVLTSAANFTTGRMVEIAVSSPINYVHVCEVLSVAGNTIQITPPMPFAVATTDTYVLTATEPAEDISIQGLTFDGNSNTSLTRGLYLLYFRDSSLRDLHFHNFAGGAACLMFVGASNNLMNLSDHNSGTGTEAAFNIARQTEMQARGISGSNSSGFGQLWQYGTYNQLSQLDAQRCGQGGTGRRGLKFDAMLYCTLSDLIGNDSNSTGIAISTGTSFCVFNNLIALRNRGGTGGNDIGIWFDGTSSDNVINGVIAKNNQNADIYIGTGNSRNVIINADYDVLSDGSTGTVGGTDNVVLATQGVTSGIVLGWVDVNLNSANTDFPITLKKPTKYYIVTGFVVINIGATASLTNARGGVFGATGGGAPTFLADSALSTITSNTPGTATNQIVFSSAFQHYLSSSQSIYFRTSTAQGAAASVRVYVIARPLPD